MGDINVRIDDIYVWSENPRHADEIDDHNISETDVINILIYIVGHDYMYNLANDILNDGLMGNLKPVVVEKDAKLLVYDGNRRVAAIKILIEPKIINDDNIKLRKKIEDLLKNTKKLEEKLDLLKNIDVYQTTEEEAFKIIDKTHGGINKGIGIIPWDAYQKDCSLFKKGDNLIYPSAFKVVRLLGLKRKDIQEDYTSLERIFGSTAFKNKFNINNYDQLNIDFLKKLYKLVYEYKKTVKNNQGLSRIFNNVSQESEKFYNWSIPQLNPEEHYDIQFNFKEVNIFKNQKLDVSKLKFDILKYDGTNVIIDRKKLKKTFFKPDGREASFDESIVGKWLYVVTYEKSSKNLAINVNNYITPLLSLNKNKITLYKKESISDLRDNILIATNSINQNIKEKVIINSEKAIVINDSFYSNQNVGTYVINYQYQDPYTHKEVTALLEVVVTDNEKKILAEPDKEQSLLTFDRPEILEKYVNKFDNSLRHLINEINSLNVDKYLYVLSASLRSVIHLLDVEYSAYSGKPCGNNLNKQLDNLLEALINDFANDHQISQKERWVNNQSLMNLFRGLKRNKDGLISVLNLGAHSSGSLMSPRLLKNAGKEVSSILSYIAILIN